MLPVGQRRPPLAPPRRSGTGGGERERGDSYEGGRASAEGRTRGHAAAAAGARAGRAAAPRARAGKNHHCYLPYIHTLNTH